MSASPDSAAPPSRSLQSLLLQSRSSLLTSDDLAQSGFFPPPIAQPAALLDEAPIPTLQHQMRKQEQQLEPHSEAMQQRTQAMLQQQQLQQQQQQQQQQSFAPPSPQQRQLDSSSISVQLQPLHSALQPLSPGGFPYSPSRPGAHGVTMAPFSPSPAPAAAAPAQAAIAPSLSSLLDNYRANQQHREASLSMMHAPAGAPLPIATSVASAASHSLHVPSAAASSSRRPSVSQQQQQQQTPMALSAIQPPLTTLQVNFQTPLMTSQSAANSRRPSTQIEQTPINQQMSRRPSSAQPFVGGGGTLNQQPSSDDFAVRSDMHAPLNRFTPMHSPNTVGSIFARALMMPTPVPAPALAAAAPSHHIQSPSSSVYLTHLVQDKEAQLASSLVQQQQAAAQMQAMAQEIDTLKFQMLQAQEQHARDTNLHAAQHQHALTSLQHSHALELQQISARAESQQLARDQQAKTLEDARVQAAARAQQVLEDTRQQLQLQAQAQHDQDQLSLEQERMQLLGQLQTRESTMQAREAAFRQKEADFEQLLASTQQLCVDKENEMARQMEERQRQQDQRVAEMQMQLQNRLHERQRELEAEFMEKERVLVDQLQSARASESATLSDVVQRRKELEREWAAMERDKLAALSAREAELARQYSEKLAWLENERVHALDSVHANQLLIDQGNESKMRTILDKYKQRVAQLEDEARDLVQAKLKAHDAVILLREESRTKHSKLESMLNEYKTLVGEQSDQLELQKRAHASQSEELARVKHIYELLIGKLGEAEEIKRNHLASQTHQVRDSQAQLERALRQAEQERDMFKTELATLQHSQSALQLEHSRLLSSSRLLSESKSLAEGESERLRLENRRLLKESEKMEVLLYGHKKGATAAASHTKTLSNGGGAAAAASKRTTTRSAVAPAPTGSDFTSPGASYLSSVAPSFAQSGASNVAGDFSHTALGSAR